MTTKPAKKQRRQAATTGDKTEPTEEQLEAQLRELIEDVQRRLAAADARVDLMLRHKAS